MDYQMLVLDIDGTLANSRKEISKKTLEALLRLQQHGVRLVLASGRPPAGIRRYAQELHLSDYGNFIVSFNGARIINCRSGEVLYNRTLPPETLPVLYDIAVRHHVGLVTYDADDSVITGTDTDPYMELEAGINGLAIKKVKDFTGYVNFPVNKCLMTGEPSVLEPLVSSMKKQFHGLLNIFRSEPYFIEVVPQRVDKAYSLLKLLSALGLTPDQMICCGDGFNDISMLECAGLGVAMANAQPPVLKAADFITRSNDEDGLLPVIETYFRH